jgi:flagella basal body P-ring formation protein FlgA
MVRMMKITKPGVYAVNESEVVGHVSRKELKQGEPIQLELLSGPGALKKGRKVRIVARYGGLTAVSEGTLMDDGSPGDEVRVRRAGNKKAVLRARIVDENTVEVNVQ